MWKDEWLSMTEPANELFLQHLDEERKTALLTELQDMTVEAAANVLGEVKNGPGSESCKLDLLGRLGSDELPFCVEAMEKCPRARDQRWRGGACRAIAAGADSVC